MNRDVPAIFNKRLGHNTKETNNTTLSGYQKTIRHSSFVTRN